MSFSASRQARRHPFSIDDPLPIVANMQNTLEILGSVTGINGYSGNLTFAATAVPEASTLGDDASRFRRDRRPLPSSPDRYQGCDA